jgi:agmatine/peptidylarginine deiminase
MRENKLDLSVANSKKKPDKVDRREFMKRAGRVVLGAAGTMGVGGILNPDSAWAGLRRKEVRDKSFIENQIIEQAESPNNLEFTPEYERNIDKILISIPQKSEREKHKMPLKQYLFATYGDLVKALPNYSQIKCLVSQEDAAEVKEFFEDYEISIEIEPTAVEDYGIELWAQDFGEMVEINGERRFIATSSVENERGGESNQRKKNIKRNINKIFGEEKIWETDFQFEGGNIFFDDFDGEKRLFIGFSDIEETVRVKASKGITMTKREVARAISKELGGVKVIVMNNEGQNVNLPHLDQSMVFLSNKKVMVCNYDKPDYIKKMHDNYTLQLKLQGYEVIPLELKEEDFFNHFTPLNCIPYVDKATGEKKVILNVLEEYVEGDVFYKSKKLLKEEDLKGSALKTYQQFKKAGYEPTIVRDFITHFRRGSVHCISNVLS